MFFFSLASFFPISAIFFCSSPLTENLEQAILFEMFGYSKLYDCLAIAHVEVTD